MKIILTFIFALIGILSPLGGWFLYNVLELVYPTSSGSLGMVLTVVVFAIMVACIGAITTINDKLNKL